MWVQRRIETPKGRKSVHIRSSFLKVGKYNDALLVSGKVVLMGVPHAIKDHAKIHSQMYSFQCHKGTNKHKIGLEIGM